MKSKIGTDQISERNLLFNSLQKGRLSIRRIVYNIIKKKWYNFNIRFKVILICLLCIYDNIIGTAKSSHMVTGEKFSSKKPNFMCVCPHISPKLTSGLFVVLIDHICFNLQYTKNHVEIVSVSSFCWNIYKNL